MNAASPVLEGKGVILLIYSFKSTFSLNFLYRVDSFLAYQVSRVKISTSINCFFPMWSSFPLSFLFSSLIWNLGKHSMSDGRVSKRFAFCSIDGFDLLLESLSMMVSDLLVVPLGSMRGSR